MLAVSMENMINKKKRIILISTIIAIIAIIVFCAIYVNDYYRADFEAISNFDSFDSSKITTLDNNTMVFEPDDAKVGFIFYPGGKVEYTSYIPLMKACASKGILCVLIKMPFNLAVLDMNAADGIQKIYSEIDEWYIGGHSLGGSMAASYAVKHTSEFEGLILLGAYSTADISESSLDVLSIYGSEDKVMNSEKYEEYKSNLPNDFYEYIIDGGCHAYFGMYGEQKGDGLPLISNEEQIELTAKKILEIIQK